MLVETGDVRDGLAWVLGRSRELEGLRAMEGGRETDLADLLRVHLSLVNLAAKKGIRDEDLRPSMQTLQQHWLVWSLSLAYQHLLHLRISNRS